MNCRECKEQLVAYMEGELDDAAAQDVRDHLDGCATCRAEEKATQSLRDRLLTAADLPTSTSLQQPVMDRILIQEVALVRRHKMRKRLRNYAMVGLAAALVVSLTWIVLQSAPTMATAGEIISRGVEAATNLKSIYLKCRMRTLPSDNFENLAPNHELVDVELWKTFEPLKWKVAKPGRVAVMDGRETVMLIGNRVGVKLDVAARSAFDTEWIQRLAAVDQMLTSELAALKAAGYDVETAHEDAETHEVIIQVDTKEKVGEYLKNKFLSGADTCRVYTFDPESGRLVGAKFYCRADDKEVLVLEIAKIQYNPPLDDSVFKLEIPEGIVWSREPQRLPDNEKYEKMTPAEAARAFFEACAKKDWDEAEKFFPMPIDTRLRDLFGGLEIIRLGEPFQSKPYGGWFVPYEIRLSEGQVLKHNLALRKDNPAHRWQVDGGI